MSYFGKQEHKKRLKKLYNKSHRHWCSGVYYDEDKERYVRYYRGSRSKFLKRVGNRKLRRSAKNLNLQHGDYKKFFDFWWEFD